MENIIKFVNAKLNMKENLTPILKDQEHLTHQNISEQQESIPTLNQIEIKESDEYDLKTCHIV
jgi:hypothetical protein